MKMLLFGATGMLGTAIRQEASKLKYEVISPSHKDCSIELEDSVYDVFQPVDLVINAAGVIPRPEEKYLANSLGPLHIAKAAKLFNVQMIHISTDCVFSGKRGPWHSVEDIPDPVDMYGVSKRFGEVAIQSVYPKATIVRTSFIGYQHGLLHWFMNLPKGSSVEGYNEVFWSGSSVYEVARRIFKDVIPRSNGGIEHLATELPVTKCEVLLEFQKHFRQDIKVNRVSEPLIHRALKPTIAMNYLSVVMDELVKKA